ncbi:serine hydrolase, partial [Alteromonas mediterranea]|uniref:serine hydrolase n=1 Tax=Alteromonas mediterranea TaxID=314275 RepID=UPI00241FC299
MTTNKIFASFALLLCFASLLGCAEPEALPASPSPAEESKEANLLKTGLTERIRIEGQEIDYQSLEQRQAHYDVPGVSVAFMRNGQLAWTMQSGVKDVTTELVVDENTVFQAGSISKPAFASVLMKYRQDNPIDLDTDVNNLLTSWQLPE